MLLGLETWWMGNLFRHVHNRLVNELKIKDFSSHTISPQAVSSEFSSPQKINYSKISITGNETLFAVLLIISMQFKCVWNIKFCISLRKIIVWNLLHFHFYSLMRKCTWKWKWFEKLSSFYFYFIEGILCGIIKMNSLKNISPILVKYS